MQRFSIMQQPLISVIVPCYNHGQYLSTAIESILSQLYKNHEIIVVDDGSIDNTKLIAEKYVEVKYVYQSNQGLSAARNKGIEKSTGKFLVFLDADDWLVPEALLTNLKHFKKNPEVAFVSGAYEFFYAWIKEKSELWQNNLQHSPYCHLLEKNFIGMHASVLFQRWIFDSFKYDTTLKSCEDYDLYLKITRNFSITVHNELIAVYRLHIDNMSSNYVRMLESALLVLERQKELLKNKTEVQWFKKGIIYWKSYYSKKLYQKVLYQLYDVDRKVIKEDIENLKHYNTLLYVKFIYYINIKYKIKNLTIRS
ncbi:MAG: glycosyltransferase family 2 protein [Janthinobacterium lividum]